MNAQRVPYGALHIVVTWIQGGHLISPIVCIGLTWGMCESLNRRHRCRGGLRSRDVDQPGRYSHGPPSPASMRVFERWHRLEGVLRSAGENEFALDLPYLAHRYRDIMRADAQETSYSDDGVRDCLVGGDDDIVDRSDPL